MLLQCEASDAATLRDVQEQGARDQMRRLGDVVIACILLAITLPLMIIVALAIKWESPGPFWTGAAASAATAGVFQMLKFRTAVRSGTCDAGMGRRRIPGWAALSGTPVSKPPAAHQCAPW